MFTLGRPAPDLAQANRLWHLASLRWYHVKESCIYEESESVNPSLCIHLERSTFEMMDTGISVPSAMRESFFNGRRLISYFVNAVSELPSTCSRELDEDLVSADTVVYNQA